MIIEKMMFNRFDRNTELTIKILGLYLLGLSYVVEEKFFEIIICNYSIIFEWGAE